MATPTPIKIGLAAAKAVTAEAMPEKADAALDILAMLLNIDTAWPPMLTIPNKVCKNLSPSDKFSSVQIEPNYFI
mgnify:FL=1